MSTVVTPHSQGFRAALDYLFARPRAVLGWAIASLIANTGIILTGGVVRLTGSGMGCPTWPRCTDDSYVAQPELGIHGAIEFANRLLTFVLIVIAIGTAISAFRARTPDGDRRPDLRRLAVILGLGVPLQAIVGGIVVLTHLNPSIVAPHLLVSLVLVGLATIYLRRAALVEQAERPAVTSAWGRRLGYATLAAMGVTVVIGTMVTGSGPHSGDASAVRNGLDSELISHVHAIAVYVTVGLTVATLILTRSRAAVALLVVEFGQGAIGFIQFYNGLPEVLVALHLLGAAASVAAAANLAWSVSNASRMAPLRPRGDQVVSRDSNSAAVE